MARVFLRFVSLLPGFALFAVLLTLTTPRASAWSSPPTAGGDKKAKPPGVQVDVVLAEVRCQTGNLGARELSPCETFLVMTWLDAMRQLGLAKVIAEPRLVTLSGRQASFLDGPEHAIPVPAGTGSIGIQFEEFSNRIDVTPTVKDGGKIDLELEYELSALDPKSGTMIDGKRVPGPVTSRMRTTLELKVGKTLLIFGGSHRLETSPGYSWTLNLLLCPWRLLGEFLVPAETATFILVTPSVVDAATVDRLKSFEEFLNGILDASRR